MKSSKQLLVSSAAIASLACAAFSAPAFAKKPAWAEKNDQTIVEFAIDASGMPFDFDADGEDFDVLVAALVATGVVGIFDGTDYTVFAPNDQAFYDLTGTNNDEDAFNAAVSLLGVDGVAAVLGYHVTFGVRNSLSISRGNGGPKEVEMFDGNSIIVVINDEEAVINANNSVSGFGDDIDIRLEDGIIHTIDTVLLP